jgi:uncharacterized protein (TIRG00374 family)
MKKNLKSFIKLVITVALLFFIFIKLDIDILSIFYRIRYSVYIVLTFSLPILVIPYISTNRWRLFLSQIDVHEKLLNLVKINFKAMFMGLLLPSSQGFDVLRVLFIEKEHPEHKGEVGSTVLIERIFGFTLLAFWAFLFSLFLPQSPDKKTVVLITSICFLAVVLVVILITRPVLNKWLLKLKTKSKILNSIIDYITIIQKTLSVFPYKKVFFSSLFLISLFQLSTVLAVALIFKAYGLDIPFAQHMALYPIISILSIIPISISGFGVREGFFAYFYSTVGVDPSIAVSVSLLNYCIITLFPSLLGGFIYLWESVKLIIKR